MSESKDESKFGFTWQCDFCDTLSEHLYTINDGLWAICKSCYDNEYGECHPPEYCVNKSCECEEE